MKRFLSLCVCMLLIVSLTFIAFGTACADQHVSRVRILREGVSLCNAPDGSVIARLQYGAEVDVYDQMNGWYYVYCSGIYGWVSENDAEPVPSSGTRTGSDELHDMGVPAIGNVVFPKEAMNMVIYWVQTQLKATGIWYQGEQWDVTGKLGDHTMKEISSFMQSMGYPGHSGLVDQNVINALRDYLGNRLVPVYVGGFYNGMKSIMANDTWGSMQLIVSNLRDMVPRETIGARWVQVVLNQLGYYSGPIDGKYGEKTEEAVKKFQLAHGFQDRDYVSLGVARCMIEQYYYAGGSVSRLP